MVLWTELSSIIARNSERNNTVASLTICTANESIDKFTIGKNAVLARPSTIVSTPIIAVEVPPTPPAEAVPAAAATSAAAAPVVAELRELKEPFSTKHPIDPIVLGIEQSDPLYLGAPRRTQHKIEIEEAQRLEKCLDELYKSCAGRSRGWTKVGLEGMIKPRCSSGGDLKELDRAKKPFLWPIASSDKPTSAFLDFVCLAKKIRLALWDADKKRVYIYPAADAPVLDSSDRSTFPLYHIDTTGHPRHGFSSCEELVKFCDSNKWVLLPPASVFHSLSGLTLDELESVGKRLGMPTVSGNKAERVAAVAAYKTRQRLGH